MQANNIRSRLRRLRTGEGHGRNADAFNLSASHSSSSTNNQNNSIASNSATASISSASATASPAEQHFADRSWSMWGESMVSTGSDHKNGNNNDHTTLGITLGIDRFFTECFALGFSLGIAHDKTDVGKNGSEANGNAYTAALYGSYSLPQGFFIDAAAGYSRLDLDSKRFTPAGFAHGDRDGNQYFATVESGYDFRMSNLTLSPYGRIDASTARLDAYSERGANALRYDANSVNLFSLTAGVRGEYAIAMCWGNLIPAAGLEYTHNFRDTTSQKMGFVSEGTLPYTLRSQSIATNQFGASLGLDAQFHNGWTVGGEYRGAYARERRDHAFYFRIAREW